MCSKSFSLITIMDLITTTPGLLHIAEQIFSNLDRNDLLQCQEVNESWASILRNPWFWYKRMMKNTTLSEEHQREWSNFCEKLSKLNLTKDMTRGLNNIYEDLEYSQTLHECYWNYQDNSPSVFSSRSSPRSSSVSDGFIMDSQHQSVMDCDKLINNYQKRIKKREDMMLKNDEMVEVMIIMAPLMENPNAPNLYGWTPIHLSARNGHKEMVKILMPLTDNPNPPDKYGRTPIHVAAYEGHTEIVKILAPLTHNPNVPANDGITPIHEAACEGHLEILEILIPLTDNPNVRDIHGDTPIIKAACCGHLEIVKILIPLMDNPNAPDKDGRTPIHWAAYRGHTEIVKYLQTCKGVWTYRNC